MILLITGILFLALGLFSGAMLVAAPLGLTGWPPGFVVWILFPLFSLTGYLIAVVGARAARISGLSFIVSCVLLLLTVASAVGLVLCAVGVIEPVATTLSLWYVLLTAGSTGIIGAASHLKQQDSSV